MTPPARDLAARLQAYAEAVEDYQHGHVINVAHIEALLVARRALPILAPLCEAYESARARLVRAERDRSGVADAIEGQRLAWRAVVAAADAAEMGRAA